MSWFGKIFGKQKPPLDREVLVIRPSDTWRSYPSERLTPQKLGRIFKEADQGDIARQVELFEDIEEKDARIHAVLQTRKQAVVGLPWEIEGQGRVAKAVRQMVQGITNFDEALTDLLDAVGKGFAVTEIAWQYEDGMWWPRALNWKPQSRFRWDDSMTRLLVVTDEEPMGMALPQNKFVVHQYKARSGHPNRTALLRTVAWMYLFKHYSIKDWLVFAEVYGMPLRVGKFDVGTSEADKRALLDAVRGLGSDGAAIISKNTEIEFVEAAGKGSSDIYKALIDLANTEIALAVLGQNLTTEVKGGSYAAANVHDRVRMDLVEADCLNLARTLNTQLIRPFVDINFGQRTEYPGIKFRYEQPEDLMELAKRDQVLAQIGVPIPVSYFRQKYGIPEPQDGEDVIQPGGGSVMGARPVKAERFTPDQAHVEQLVENTINQVDASKINDAIKAAVMDARDYEDMQKRLMELMREYRMQDFEDLASRAEFYARLYGMARVVQEINDTEES